MECMLELKTRGYVAIAMLLGGGIGFERELVDKPAGMCTRMLVAGAIFTLVTLRVVRAIETSLKRKKDTLA